MTGQTEQQQQPDQVAKTLLTMAAIMSAAVAVASATLWSDVTSAVVFGFLTVVMTGMLLGLPTQRDRLTAGDARREIKLLFLVSTGVWVVATLLATGVAVQADGSNQSLVWVAACAGFSLLSLLAARRADPEPRRTRRTPGPHR